MPSLAKDVSAPTNTIYHSVPTAAKWSESVGSICDLLRAFSACKKLPTTARLAANMAKPCFINFDVSDSVGLRTRNRISMPVKAIAATNPMTPHFLTET